MAAINTSKIYVLKNSFTAAAKVLALSANGNSLSMVDAGSAGSGGYWFLTPTHTANFYRLHTIVNGVKQSLDVINDNGVQSTKLHLTTTGDYSGQFWRFDDWHTNSAYPYRLSNNFTGPDAHLDVYSDTLVAHLAGGDYSGQYWVLIPADTVVVTTS